MEIQNSDPWVGVYQGGQCKLTGHGFIPQRIDIGDNVEPKMNACLHQRQTCGGQEWGFGFLEADNHIGFGDFV